MTLGDLSGPNSVCIKSKIKKKKLRVSNDDNGSSPMTDHKYFYLYVHTHTLNKIATFLILIFFSFSCPGCWHIIDRRTTYKTKDDEDDDEAESGPALHIHPLYNWCLPYTNYPLLISPFIITMRKKELIFYITVREKKERNEWMDEI